MWATLFLTVAAVVAYASEWATIELTSVGVLVALLLLFHLTPAGHRQRADARTAADILSGFSSPALIAVSALLVVGQAMVSTGALEGIARFLRMDLARQLLPGAGLQPGLRHRQQRLPQQHADRGHLHADPALDRRALRLLASAVMMPLSFAAILGGMLTLIGTSTNLLVSGELARLGQQPFDFFDLTVPGLVLALAGGVYIILLPALPAPAGRVRRSGDGRRQAVHRRDRRRIRSEAGRRGIPRRLVSRASRT